MRVDVVIPYWEQAHLWSFVSKGLSDNRQHINNVIVVSDGPWQHPLPPPDGVRMLTLEHERRGFGKARALNLAARYVATDYMVQLDGDMMLVHDSIASNLRLVDAELLVCGLIHDADVINDAVIKWRDDDRAGKDVPAAWFNVRGGYIVMPTAGYLAINGHDEGYTEYGFEDYDFAARWMREYGDDSWALGSGAAMHLDSRRRHVLSRSSQKRFIDKLGGLNATWRLRQHTTQD